MLDCAGLCAVWVVAVLGVGSGVVSRGKLIG